MSVHSGGTYEIDPASGDHKRVGEPTKTLSRAERRALEHDQAAKAEAEAKADVKGSGTTAKPKDKPSDPTPAKPAATSLSATRSAGSKE